MEIKLLSTWSKFSSESEISPNVRLVTHQREVWDAIIDPKIQVVLDTALTGDGKTLAGLLPAVRERKSLDKALFAYPTNELIRDQDRQFRLWSDRLQINSKVGQLNSSELSRLMHDEGLSKAETLRTIASDKDIVLTNPDIFTLIHRLYYDKRSANAATIAQTWLAQYRYIIFDEFHIFSAPQVANVLDGIAFIRANSTEKFPTKFLFLSATPDPLLVNAFTKAGISSKVVVGSYQHGLQDSITHRRILHEVKLKLVSSKSVFEKFFRIKKLPKV